LSKGEAAMQQMLDAYQVPYVREFRFAPPRRWRADFALLEPRILIEVQGGHWISGRHNHAISYEAELERINAAQIAGYRVLQYTTRQVVSGEAILEVMQLLEASR
jgi:very-short-patch-repair endonuclease